MTISLLRVKPRLKSILVVDDDPETLRTLRDVLPDTVWKIDTAANRRTAAPMLRAHQSDVVLLNTDIGGSERPDLLWLLKQVRPKARIILITPSGAHADVIHAIREHVFSYFSKPLVASQLKEMIERAAEATGWEDGIEVLSARPGWISLRLLCRKLTADRLVQFFRELDAPLPDSERADVATAFREMLLNAIQHGAGFDRYQTVQVSYFRTARAIIYLIQDPGSGFAHESLRGVGDLAAAMGGLGILTARFLVDDLIYSEKGNEVLLIKYLNP